MALAIDVMHGCGPSNKMRIQLQPKKTKVHKAILAVSMAAKRHYTQCTLLTRWSALVLKVGMLYGWLLVLWY